MTYLQWFNSHGDKSNVLIGKLLDLSYSQKEIIEYFRFENMVKKEPDFCPLYAKNQKCHDIKELNCIFCGCPFFRFDKKSSSCSINSHEGKKIFSQDGTYHQDCSNCIVPHREKFIISHFHYNWFEVMKDCSI